MNRTIKFSMLLPATALTFGLATSANAQDVYNGCSKNTTSKLRGSSVLVNATPACRDTETPRTWKEGFSSCGPEEVTGTCNANTFAVLNLFIAVIVNGMEKEVASDLRADEAKHAAVLLEEIRALRREVAELRESDRV